MLALGLNTPSITLRVLLPATWALCKQVQDRDIQLRQESKWREGLSKDRLQQYTLIDLAGFEDYGYRDT